MLHLKNLYVYIYILLYSVNADSIQVFPKKCSVLLYLVPKASYFGSDKEVWLTTDPYQFNPCYRSCRKGMKHKMTNDFEEETLTFCKVLPEKQSH